MILFKTNRRRAAIYIDGNNTYFKLKDLNLRNLTNFNYRKLADWLAGNREVISYRYYIGKIHTADDNLKGQELRKNQQRLFAHLQSQGQGFIIKEGRLMENGGRYHEKGVDVKLAVDLVVGAFDDLYDDAIIISSDTDLIPAIKKVKHLKKKVEYIGFSHKPSLGIQKNVSRSRLLTLEELKNFEISD
ncbi:MAG: NYN domain-containing protein [bacterium]|nr:NYN domain-containing protein [bacterium]